MPFKSIFVAMMFLSCVSLSLLGQDSIPFESGRDEEVPVTTRARIFEGRLELERFVPQTIEKEQVYQVDVPVTEMIEERGETKAVTRTVKETRVRLVQVNQIVTEIVSIDLKNVKFSTVSGAKLEDPEVVADMLEEFRPALFVFKDEPLSPYHAQFYSKRLVVIYVPESEEDNKEDDGIDDADGDGQDKH